MLQLEPRGDGEWLVRRVMEVGYRPRWVDVGRVKVEADEAALKAVVSFIKYEECAREEEWEALGRVWVYLVACGFCVVVPDAMLVGAVPYGEAQSSESLAKEEGNLHPARNAVG